MRKVWIRKKELGITLVAFTILVLATFAIAVPSDFQVKPFRFDPNRTDLVAARWVDGAGCPTGATSVPFGGPPSSFTDSACPTGDPKDMNNAGLVLIKAGPTTNFAAGGAEIKGVTGITLSELGYDIRTGSHCGAGAPRFNVVTTDGVTHFVGCNSPTPIIVSFSLGWKRLRWSAAQLVAAFPPILPTDTVKSIAIIFDEGQDASGGPDSAGFAVIDNIDINGTLVGTGDKGIPF